MNGVAIEFRSFRFILDPPASERGFQSVVSFVCSGSGSAEAFEGEAHFVSPTPVTLGARCEDVRVLREIGIGNGWAGALALPSWVDREALMEAAGEYREQLLGRHFVGFAAPHDWALPDHLVIHAFRQYHFRREERGWARLQEGGRRAA